MTTDQSRELCELTTWLEHHGQVQCADATVRLREAARELRLMAEVVEQRDDAIARATKEMLDHETTKKECDTLRAQVESLKDELFSKQGVLDAVDKVLAELHWIHASRAIAIRNGVESLEKQCGVLRHVVEMWQEIGPDEESQQYVDAALKSTAGRDYFRVCPQCGYEVKK